MSPMADWGSGTDMSHFPVIEPDIVIENKLVIDTKYYRDILGSNNKFHSSNLYQIITYMNAFNLPGLLLYPQFSIPYNETFKVDQRNIHIKTINLGQSRNELFYELFNFTEYIKKSTTKI